MTVPPVVVDTNIVVAALVTPMREAGTARLLAAMLDGRRLFLLSLELLAEWNEVLKRPRIARRHRLSADEIEAILIELTDRAVIREIDPTSDRKGDAHILALVASDPRALLVSGDAPLRRRLPGRSLTPGDFLARWPL